MCEAVQPTGRPVWRTLPAILSPSRANRVPTPTRSRPRLRPATPVTVLSARSAPCCEIGVCEEADLRVTASKTLRQVPPAATRVATAAAPPALPCAASPLAVAAATAPPAHPRRRRDQEDLQRERLSRVRDQDRVPGRQERELKVAVLTTDTATGYPTRRRPAGPRAGRAPDSGPDTNGVAGQHPDLGRRRPAAMSTIRCPITTPRYRVPAVPTQTHDTPGRGWMRAGRIDSARRRRGNAGPGSAGRGPARSPRTTRRWPFRRS
jgi:hypothetical protein